MIVKHEKFEKTSIDYSIDDNQLANILKSIVDNFENIDFVVKN